MCMPGRHRHGWTGRKVPEKLDDMHNNLVKRGLVEKPGDWALVELEALLPGTHFRADDGSDAVIAGSKMRLAKVAPC